MGIFGGLIFGPGFFDLLLQFDHPHHLKYRVPVDSDAISDLLMP